MIEKKIGKIRDINFGFGGYQDVQIGITVDLGSDKEHWGTGDFRGYWADRSDGAEWTEADQRLGLGGVVLWLRDLLKEAKVSKIDKLKDMPVEVIFENNVLKSWRILTEVI